MSAGPPSLKDVQWITLGEVPAYLLKVHNITRQRQTVYNWAEKGLHKALGRTVKLKTQMRAGMIYTTRAWVRRFLDDTSRY